MTESQFPSGSVTFLFTDIEGSSRLIDELGEESYVAALAEHRRLLRAAFTAGGGVEVDTQGDAFLYAFGNPAEALAAAAQGQQALESGPVRVRMGLHTGEALLTGEGYAGRELHRAARIAASGHGGQVVLSAATRALVDGELIELGEHRLKDFDEPVALFQLGKVVFPPLKTISNTNLPRPASSFVGRGREREELVGLLRNGARLVTLSGPGGSGKTRLALEAAWELVPAFKAGVFWVGLAALRDPALVAQTIAQTLGAARSLAEHIAERELLLLLDNFEQVVGAAPELSHLLEACPNLQLLVTSRELLRVRGERDYPVPPLAHPEAVELFRQRAQLEQDATIAELCARLDNLPLAVELAAARTRVLSPAQIVERLTHRLDLLKAGRDADPRQRTLRATIAWSHDLLDPDEQQLFARLAIFAGGCTLQAAEEVAEADLDTLESLVDKSLVRRRGERFWMIETIREYALECFEHDAAAGPIPRKHAEFFLALAEREEGELRSPGERSALARFDAEHDNLRAALAWSIGNAQADVALRLVGALDTFWYHRGHYSEGRRWADEALALAGGTDTIARIKTLSAAGQFALFQNDYAAARAQLEERLALSQELDDRGRVASSFTLLAELAFSEQDFKRARECYERALALTTEPGGSTESWLTPAVALGNVGWVLLAQGELGAAEARFEQALVAARQEGSTLAEAAVLNNLAWVAIERGDLEGIDQLVGQSLAILRENEDGRLFIECFELVARVGSRRGESERAARFAGFASGLRDELGLGLADAPHQASLDRSRAELGDAAWERAWDAGRAMPLDEAIDQALASTAAPGS
jgi:predicted ATPase